ncbi:MAG: DMT family transporter [Crocinitomicaceae bacterium]|nr:DMT family transporter [Crocinitomicaceae bacterium]
MNNKLKAHIALFSVNAFYGANNIIAKDVMPTYLTPNVFIAFRVLGATTLFWLISLFTKREKVARKDLFLLAICGIFGVAINQLCFFHGLNRSSAINSGIIMTINPIAVAIMAYFILKESLNATKIVGIFIGAIGASLLAIQSNGGNESTLLGDILLIINALSYAVYLIIVKPLMSKYSALTVTTYVFTFGAMYVFIFPQTLMDFSVIDFSIIPWDAWLRILYVIVCVTFLTYLLTMYAMKFVSASVTSTYIYLQPILVIFFAYFFYYIGLSADNTKSITSIKIALMLVIFLGVYLVIRSESIGNNIRQIKEKVKARK